MYIVRANMTVRPLAYRSGKYLHGIEQKCAHKNLEFHVYIIMIKCLQEHGNNFLVLRKY